MTNNVKAAIVAVVVMILAATTLIINMPPSNAERVTNPRIHACHEDEVVAASGRCVHPDSAEFRAGYWYAQ